MYNFEVGDYVKYKGREYQRMGVVVKIDDDVVSVFFRYPDFQTSAIYGKLLTKATTEEYAEYVDEEEDKIARKLINPTLYAYDNDEKSFDQALDELVNGFNEVFWVEDEPMKLKKNFGITFDNNDIGMYILNKPTMDTRHQELGGHKEWQSALKQAYIDMALDTQDWEWLKELTKGE